MNFVIKAECLPRGITSFLAIFPEAFVKTLDVNNGETNIQVHLSQSQLLSNFRYF